MQSTITSKGQATIPKAVRDALGVAPGDQIKFLLDANDKVVIVGRLPVHRLKGSVKHGRSKAPTQEEMDAAVEQGAIERFLRSTRA
jgi:AbrB family looped-hinge helix DNA binding protein